MWRGLFVLLLSGCQSMNPPKRVCAPAKTTMGIDGSYYQGVIDWGAVKSGGVEFAFIRVSDGLTQPDARFAANWQGARAAGVKRGAYQRFRPGDDADAQAMLVLTALSADPGELAPALDIEEVSGMDATLVTQAVKTWLSRIENGLSRTPIIYLSPSVGTYLDFANSFSRNPLWIANYDATCPLVPSPWHDWMVWQYSDSGSVPGITGPVDLDVL
jgi:lysozyme